MSQRNETPPAGVELVPDDVNEELNKVEKSAHKKIVQKIMDDPEFGKRLQEDPEGTLSDESLLDELGLAEDVEGHRPYRSKWRYHWYYGYIHYTRRLGWHTH